MNNELENLNVKLREWRWLILLIVLVISTINVLISDIKVKVIYNITIILGAILLFIYLEYNLIKYVKRQYVKNSENPNYRNIKLDTILGSMFVLGTVIYFTFLLTV